MPRFHADTDSLAGPPPEVLAEIDAAWERAQELFNDEELELHFEVDRRFGRAWAELRYADGEVAETLSASEAVAPACGTPAAAELSLAAESPSCPGAFPGGARWSYRGRPAIAQGHHLRRRRSRAQGCL